MYFTPLPVRNLHKDAQVPLCVRCSSSLQCFAISGKFRLQTHLCPEIDTSRRAGCTPLQRIGVRVPRKRLFVLRATSRRDLRRPTNHSMNRTTTLRPVPPWTNIPVFRPARPISDSRWWFSWGCPRPASGPRGSCTGRSGCGTTTGVLTIGWPPSSSPSNSSPVSWSLHGVIKNIIHVIRYTSWLSCR